MLTVDSTDCLRGRIITSLKACEACRRLYLHRFAARSDQGVRNGSEADEASLPQTKVWLEGSWRGPPRHLHKGSFSRNPFPIAFSRNGITRTECREGAAALNSGVPSRRPDPVQTVRGSLPAIQLRPFVQLVDPAELSTHIVAR